MIRLLAAPVLCLAAAATLSCAGPALAQTSDAVRAGTVKYRNLDAGSRAGAQALFERIETAASTACGGVPDLRQLSRLAVFETCRRSAVARAVVAVDSPMLTAMAHIGRGDSFAAR
jgi:UrcA family protein